MRFTLCKRLAHDIENSVKPSDHATVLIDESAHFSIIMKSRCYKRFPSLSENSLIFLVAH